MGGTAVVIVGAGRLTREVLEAMSAANDQGATWRVVGILDDAPERAGTMVHDVEVIGGLDALRGLPDAQVLLCTGSPRNFASRRNLVDRLRASASNYATVVHPSAVLARSTTVGPGSILLASVVTTGDVTIGSHVVVMPAVVLTHDVRVGDYATIASGALLAGGTDVGSGAYIGAGAVIREGVSVGEGALVGMGAIVLRDVPAGEVWVGQPARRIR